MKKLLYCILIALFSTTLFAENKMFIREYMYQASEDDSKNSARAKALSEVKRLLLEELGVYMESYTNYTIEDTNGKVTKDFFQNEIKSLSAGITETKITEETWNGAQYYIKAEIEADPTDVARKINATLEKRKADVVIDSLRTLLASTQDVSIQKSEEVKVLQEKYSTQLEQVNEQQKRVDDLNKQLETLKAQLAKNQEQEQQLLSEVQQIEQRIKKATNIAIQNARLGMTTSEVIKVCGNPRGKANWSSTSYWNYGSLWLIFENDILVKGIASTNFTGAHSLPLYFDVPNILK